MSVQVFCPKCDRSCRIKPEFLGKRVRCPGCEEIFRAEEVPVAEADPPPQDIPPPHLQEFFPDPSSPTIRALDEKTIADKIASKDAPVVKPGKVENPFSEESALEGSSGPVDSSQFEFEYGDEPSPKTRPEHDRRGKSAARDGAKRSEKSDRDDGDDEDTVETKSKSESDAPDTDYAWDGRKTPPEELPSKPAKPVAGSPKAKRPTADESASPFSFGDPEETPIREAAPKPAAARREAEKPVRAVKKVPAQTEEASPFSFGNDETPVREAAPKPAPRREPEERTEKPARGTAKKVPVQNDDADFLGLQNDDAPPPKPAAARGPAKKNPVQNDDAAFLGLSDDNAAPEPAPVEKPKNKLGKRKFFHVRQAGFWSEVRLFRVFIHDESLVFISAASGKDVPEMEEAIESGNLKKCERKIRTRLIDLDEQDVEELIEGDRSGFRSPAAKTVSISIDAAPRSLLRKHGSAILRLEHKSKGAMQFDFVSDDDVNRALSYLPDLLEDLLQVNVRWDKAKDCYVAR